jgi:hypothetical protein
MVTDSNSYAGIFHLAENLMTPAPDDTTAQVVNRDRLTRKKKVRLVNLNISRKFAIVRAFCSNDSGQKITRREGIYKCNSSRKRGFQSHNK